MICRSCGGVVGRDCFNPSECQWISDRMAAEQAAQEMEEELALRYDAWMAGKVQEHIDEMRAENAGFDPIHMGM